MFLRQAEILKIDKYFKILTHFIFWIFFLYLLWRLNRINTTIALFWSGYFNLWITIPARKIRLTKSISFQRFRPSINYATTVLQLKATTNVSFLLSQILWTWFFKIQNLLKLKFDIATWDLSYKNPPRKVMDRLKMSFHFNIVFSRK